ncbi:MAG: acyltransferase [Acidobacteriota bacterium]
MARPQESTTPARNTAWDGLRALAMFMIVAHHAHILPGAVGVVVFYVLSGFLITGTLLREWRRSNHIALGNFYWRRTVRLIPGLVLFLTVLGVYSAAFQPLPVFRGYLNSAFITLFNGANWWQAYHEQESLGYLNHTWSLSFQEQFYLLWPPVLLLLLRLKLRRRWIGLILLGSVAASALARLFLWESTHDAMRVFYGSDTRADGLLAGCLLAFLADWKILPRRRLAKLALRFASIAGVALVLYVEARVPRDSDVMFRWFFPLATIAITAFVWDIHATSVSGRAKFLEFAPLVWLGQLSYGIYLWHYPFLRFAASHGPAGPFRHILWIVATVLVSAASYHFVEEPLFARSHRKRSPVILTPQSASG